MLSYSKVLTRNFNNKVLFLNNELSIDVFHINKRELEFCCYSGFMVYSSNLDSLFIKYLIGQFQQQHRCTKKYHEIFHQK